ncbi:response regulator transcription factor [Nostoc sp. FACHB-87]|uniref:response regulator transcription factor n=1 Tax=Nostocales TaxID=1161 RepID=UPI0016884221|nr:MULTISPECIES: response regulator transcription factor [Nostocales]MBD2299970.1 response regulator transcription factor [Nostoc sp. FACHB-190]MBD2457244.1 response regulator transcription factor [Nostoc sp. FACHB-87]MBD2475212.1 response regulator transcription factor [Anabaena sp. FACHB-83]MBD2489080.1 response regulator transcription factor [Aulosira sp. FACHB-615]
MIRVVVIAASVVVQVGLSSLINQHPQLTVVGTTSDLETFTKEFEQLQPDVLLLDFSSNLSSTWTKLQLISEQQILLITEDIESLDLENSLRSGVRGILPSTSTEAEITAAIEAIASGLIVLHPDYLELLPIREKVVANPVQTLTPREIEVLGMLGSGLGNKAIAKRLQISEHTVKFHVSSIFQKLAVSSRTEAVTAGVRLGLIML